VNELATRNIVLPAHERLRGRSTLRFYRELQASERLSPEDLGALQLRKLRRLAAHAVRNVPWYRDRARDVLAVPPERMTLDDFRAFPVVTKDDIRADLRAFCAEGFADRLIRYSTGGSSGDPLVFYTDKAKEAWHKAHDWRCRSWFGVHPGDRQLDIWGSPIELQRNSGFRKWKDRYLLNHLVVSAFDLRSETLSRYSAILTSWRPRIVYGYPGVLTVLAQSMLEHGVNLGADRPKMVSCTSEVLYPLQRDTIQEAFGCMAVNEYGSRDGGLIAHECQEQQLHIAAEHVLVEVHEPDAERVGKLLITNLDGFGMPFLRYEIGDMGALGSKSCACGRPQPLLQQLTGRSNDFLVGAKGVRIHSLSPIYALRPYRHKIRQFQITQRKDLSLEVRLACAKSFEPSEVGQITERLREILAVNVPIEFAFVERIESERSGKHRAIVCEAAAADHRVQ
jgi:phenylacetate-CoA ligase